MAKRRTQIDGLLGPLETEVMEVVWRLGEATVRDVHLALALDRDLAYTTVMTTMSRLAAKGLLERDTTGLAHRYAASLTREDYARSTVHSVVDWLVDRFPEPAISYFVEVVSDEGEEATVGRLRSMVDELRASED